jgi:hypothetical protein
MLQASVDAWTSFIKTCEILNVNEVCVCAWRLQPARHSSGSNSPALQCCLRPAHSGMLPTSEHC